MKPGVDTLNRRVQNQRDPKKLEDYANRSLMKVRKEKCKDLHLEQSKHNQVINWLSSGLVEKDFGYLGGLIANLVLLSQVQETA